MPTNTLASRSTLPVIVTVLESPAETIGCMAKHRRPPPGKLGAATL